MFDLGNSGPLCGFVAGHVERHKARYLRRCRGWKQETASARYVGRAYFIKSRRRRGRREARAGERLERLPRGIILRISFVIQRRRFVAGWR